MSRPRGRGVRRGDRARCWSCGDRGLRTADASGLCRSCLVGSLDQAQRLLRTAPSSSREAWVMRCRRIEATIADLRNRRCDVCERALGSPAMTWTLLCGFDGYGVERGVVIRSDAVSVLYHHRCLPPGGLEALAGELNDRPRTYTLDPSPKSTGLFSTKPRPAVPNSDSRPAATGAVLRGFMGIVYR